MRVPRAPLARHLGIAAVIRLDQARGAVPEPIAPVLDEMPPAVERRLLEPIGDPEQIEVVAHDLVADLVAALRRRGLGARLVRLAARRVDGVDQAIAIGTAKPTRDAAHLMQLLKLRLDRLDPGLGLETFRLVAERTEPLAASPMAGVLAGADPPRDAAGLVDVLVGRVGPDRLFRVHPVESHVPERTVRRAGPLAAGGGWPTWPGPARLFRCPEPLAAVMTLLPDQPPRRFEWRKRVYRVASADGPERIHAEWWRREAETWAVRDYFRVEDEDGGRWWLFWRGDGEEPVTGDQS